VSALLGIDFGTTTLKAVVFDECGRMLSSAVVEPPREQRVIAGSIAEVWPADGLWERVCELLRRCTSGLTVPIDGIALVELGLVGMPILADGTAGYPAVAWMNPPDPLAGMQHDLDSHTVFGSTGNRVNPIYPPAWISWLRLRDPAFPREMSAWVYAGDYIVYRLCGEIAVDYSMASQSTVFDQRTFSYRADMLSAYGLGADAFPQPRPSASRLGGVTDAAATATGVPAGTPVMVGGADFVSGAYGSGLLHPGQAAIITGTWECTVMCSERPETGAALERCGAICDPHVAPGRWSVRIENLSGDVTEWYRDRFYRAPGGGDAVPWEDIVGDAGSVADAGGVLFLPHVFGSFGPDLDERARGAFIGLTNHTTRAHLTRAVYEGLCFQSRHSLEALAAGMEQSPDRISMMGGGAKNTLWTQIRADVIGQAVDVVDDPDVTPRGAAMIAAVGAGVHATFHDAAREMAPSTSRVEPDERAARRYDRLYNDGYLPALEALSSINHRLAAAMAHAPVSP
jgi:xylulokinase